MFPEETSHSFCVGEHRRKTTRTDIMAKMIWRMDMA